ncbi:MAG: inorganic phosphate transporter [Candidatus Aminicenantes bacterium]|nr:inorganic phosphate transporter [Candidatus Aminicenantes bacterium]
MDMTFIALVVAIFLCYVYAFVGGFTDAANAIATSIGSRALSPRTAVLMAGFLEIVGALTGTAVALTIGKGIVSLDLINLYTVIGALAGTMTWSLLTYYFGIPVSETHGLIGGIIGAAISVAGLEVIKWSGLTKILIAIVASPLLGFSAGAFLMGLVYRFSHSAPSAKMKPLYKNLQRLSAAFMAFSHGRNDAQKPMGILVMVLALHYGWKDPKVPLWVILTIGITAGAGVAYGGWRIIKTLGLKITSLETEQGFAAETSAALVLQLASALGIPVSTTHTITSSIVGAGSVRRFSAVRWDIASDIVISWVLTLPATIFLGWLYMKLLQVIF